jgi:DNA-binding response OmpR family regulator
MKKILICDDDEGILEVCKIILQENGYKVIVSDNYDQICQFAIAQRPDLILMDLWMPGIGGKETTKILKKNISTSKIPVIIISASKSALKDTIEAGADECLQKPFNITDLEKAVAKYL